MDRNDTDNIINISSEERDSRAGRGNKKVSCGFLFNKFLPVLAVWFIPRSGSMTRRINWKVR